jgi:hypothetical protein
MSNRHPRSPDEERYPKIERRNCHGATGTPGYKYNQSGKC